MYEKYKKIFKDFVLNFNNNDEDIEYKINHSYRVADLCVKIAKELYLTDEDVEICYICGLFHDVGRFQQLTETKSYDDFKFKDHGNYGAEIIERELGNVITDNEQIKNILITATKQHNKYKIEDVSEKELIFCRILRDADKIDTLQYWLVKMDGIYELNRKMVEDIKKLKPTTERYENDMDILLRMLGFVFDINFKYSFEILENRNIIASKLQLLEEHSNQNIDDIRDTINKYIQKKCLNSNCN